ncbi:MAG: nicotinate-nucleotide adenylyltransferase [Gammaproteobacteria bacterium]|nr:nicotinate-nucleotide adenylyltransferase [Gammaproteobacteria bacterium]
MTQRESGKIVGLMGGTFDPVHNGHLRVALEFKERLGLDALHLVPAATPPHRQPPWATAAQRLTMVQLAIGNNAPLEVDDRELQRPGVSYTLETLMSLQQQLPPQSKIVLLMGSDAFCHFHRWHGWQMIRQRVQLVLAIRPDHPLRQEDLPQALQSWFSSSRLVDAQTSADFAHSPAGTLWQLAVTPLAISATHLRQLCASGRSIRYLTPDPVWDYIHQNGIYQCKQMS